MFKWLKSLFEPKRKQCVRCRKTFYHCKRIERVHCYDAEITVDHVCPHCESNEWIIV